jgi:PAS domain S-box-containing protein
VPLVATSDASVIVAVSAPLVEFLGYGDESELLGRRILVVVPQRFHQAHIAGTTLHATNGRDVLLDLWLDVPLVRADGTEVVVGLHVEPKRLGGGLHLFVAHVRLPARRES